MIHCSILRRAPNERSGFGVDLQALLKVRYARAHIGRGDDQPPNVPVSIPLTNQPIARVHTSQSFDRKECLLFSWLNTSFCEANLYFC